VRPVSLALPPLPSSPAPPEPQHHSVLPSLMPQLNLWPAEIWIHSGVAAEAGEAAAPAGATPAAASAAVPRMPAPAMTRATRPARKRQDSRR